MLIPQPQGFVYRVLLPMILLSMLVACGVYPGTSRGPLPSPLPTPTITPTPLGYVEPTRTPTPTWSDPDKITPLPTSTPIATPVVVNLAEGLPRIFTYSFAIERADGRREIYTVPVGLVPMIRTESDRPIYEAYIQSVAHLGPGDRYISGCAASPYMIFVSQEMICYTKYAPPGPATPAP